jgi:CDP-diacylglycerol---serine O-phosphatidyltransferase
MSNFKITSYIPNALTLSNLFCGCCAIVCVFNNAPVDAFWFLVAAFVADALDGQAARYFGVSSPMGKELDSIADTVSFAAAPGMMLYVLLSKSFAMSTEWMKYGHVVQGVILPALPAFLVSIFGGYRLAKYNVDTRQSDKFIGVPTPANTIFVMGLWMAYATNPIIGGIPIGEVMMKPIFFFTLIPILAYWQVAEMPLMNFRFKGFGWKENQFRYTFLLMAIGSILALGIVGISAAILLYVLISLLENSLTQSK